MKPVLILALITLTPLLAAPASKKPARKVARPEQKPVSQASTKGAKPAEKTPPKPAPKVPARAMAFAPVELDLAPGESFPVELFVPSPTGKLFQGSLLYAPQPGVTVKPDERWTGRIPPWGVKTFPRISAAMNAQGQIPVEATLESGLSAGLLVNVVTPGLEVIPGQQQLTVKVTNPFRTRVLPGRILASNPDRFLEDITTREFRVMPGQTEEVVFPLPGAAPADGQVYDFTLAVETYHGFRMRKTYPLVFPKQETK